MNRHVNMFPEVFYLDVKPNTNKQKRDIFLIVVKDANGKAYIDEVKQKLGNTGGSSSRDDDEYDAGGDDFREGRDDVFRRRTAPRQRTINGIRHRKIADVVCTSKCEYIHNVDHSARKHWPPCQVRRPTSEHKHNRAHDAAHGHLAPQGNPAVFALLDPQVPTCV